MMSLLRCINLQQRQIKEQSEELKQKRREFEAVTTGMTEGIVLINNKHEILSINPAAQKILGTEKFSAGQTILLINRCLELQEVIAKADMGIRTEKIAELIANGMVKPDDTAEFSGRIYSESQRMIRLVEDIIKLSRLDEGAEDMKRDEVDLYALAEETVKSLVPVSEAVGVSISLEGEKAVINGIPQLLQGIVYNLWDNAVKYNRKGGSVKVTVTNGADSISLTVADTGIGISEEHRERIFERFYRVDKSHSKEIGGNTMLAQGCQKAAGRRQSSSLDGTGLGLSIVKYASRLHNAAI